MLYRQSYGCELLRLYTVADVAAKLKVSESTVKRLAQRDILKGGKVEGRWMFTDRQIARFVEEHTYLGGQRVGPSEEDIDALPRTD